MSSANNGVVKFFNSVYGGLQNIFSQIGLGVINMSGNARIFVSKDATNFAGINYNNVSGNVEYYTTPPYTVRMSINPTTGVVSIPNLSSNTSAAYIQINAGSSINVPILTTGLFTRINSGFTSNYLSGFSLTAARVLTYTGTATVPIRISCDISFTNVSLLVSDLLQFAIVKNATVNGNNEYTAGTIFNPQSVSGFLVANSGTASLSLIDSACAPNDNYSVFIKNITDLTNVTCTGCNLVAVKI